MLNGRIRGDSLGRFTQCSTLGAIVVNNAITDIDLSSISAFTVRPPQTSFSDHCQINVFLKKAQQPHGADHKPRNLFKLNPTYKWSSKSEAEFFSAIGSKEISDLINRFNGFHLIQIEANKIDVNSAVEQINEIFKKMCSQS